MKHSRKKMFILAAFFVAATAIGCWAEFHPPTSNSVSALALPGVFFSLCALASALMGQQSCSSGWRHCLTTLPIPGFSLLRSGCTPNCHTKYPGRLAKWLSFRRPESKVLINGVIGKVDSKHCCDSKRGDTIAFARLGNRRGCLVGILEAN